VPSGNHILLLSLYHCIVFLHGLVNTNVTFQTIHLLVFFSGDTKAGAAPCTKLLMTDPLHVIADSAKAKGIPFLYTIGDNENNDCHRDGSRVPPRAADFYKAEDARRFVLDDMDMDINYDLDVTGVFAVEAHRKNGTIPGTTKPYSCDFDVSINRICPCIFLNMIMIGVLLNFFLQCIS